MAQVLIRSLDDETVENYRQKAKINGISLEQELRNLLEAHKPLTAQERLSVSRRLRAELRDDDFDVGAAIRWGRDDEIGEPGEEPERA